MNLSRYFLKLSFSKKALEKKFSHKIAIVVEAKVSHNRLIFTDMKTNFPNPGCEFLVKLTLVVQQLDFLNFQLHWRHSVRNYAPFSSLQENS